MACTVGRALAESEANDFELGRQARALLARQDAQSLNLGRLFNELQDLLGADVSLKVPLRDLVGREVFRKLLQARQPSQQLAFKDSLVQDLQSVYSPALVGRLEAFLNGLIGSEAGDHTSQLQSEAPALNLPQGLNFKGPVEEDAATVMAADPAASTPEPAAAASAPPKPAQHKPARPLAERLRPLGIAGAVGALVVFVGLFSSRRPCPVGMQCSLASSFGFIKLSEADLRQRLAQIRTSREQAESLPDLENRRREVQQLQSELGKGGYGPELATQASALNNELGDQISREQGYYDQYKQDEAVVSSIGVVKNADEAKRLDAAARRLDAIPKTSLMRKAARYQAQMAAIKLRPFLAESKTAEMQKLMARRAKEVEAERARVQAEIRRKEAMAKAEYARLQKEQARLRSQAAAAQSRPAPRPAPPPNDDVF